MWKLRLKKITIRSEADAFQDSKILFEWVDRSASNINIFHFYNQSGKSTLYKIIEDVIEFGKLNYSDIFTSDFCYSEIKVSIEWQLNDSKIMSTKCYFRDKTKKLDQKVEIITEGFGYADNQVKMFQGISQYESEIDKILNLPTEVKYFTKKKLSFKSLLRINFINDDNYQSKIEDSKSECNIINHKFDSLTTPLYYKYLFGDYDSIPELRDLYKIAESIKQLETKNKQYNQSDKAFLDLEKGPSDLLYLYEDDRLQGYLIILKKLKNKILDLDLEKFELEESKNLIENLEQKIDQFTEYPLEVERDLTNLKGWQNLLQEYKKNLERDLIENNNSIKKNEANIEDYNNAINASKEMIESWKNSSRKKIQEYSSEVVNNQGVIDSNKTSLDIALKKLQSSIKVKEYINIVRELAGFDLRDPRASKTEFVPRSGKIRLNNSSDSTNRLERFSSLYAFLLLKDINHLGFMIVDSPFIGVDNSRIKEFLENLLQKSVDHSLDNQVFMFLNKEDEDKLDKLFENNSLVNYVTGKNDEKLFQVQSQN